MLRWLEGWMSKSLVSVCQSRKTLERWKIVIYVQVMHSSWYCLHAVDCSISVTVNQNYVEPRFFTRSTIIKLLLFRLDQTGHPSWELCWLSASSGWSFRVFVDFSGFDGCDPYRPNGDRQQSRENPSSLIQLTWLLCKDNCLKWDAFR